MGAEIQREQLAVTKKAAASAAAFEDLQSRLSKEAAKWQTLEEERRSLVVSIQKVTDALQAQVDPLSTKLEQLLFAQQEQLAFASSLQNLTIDVREVANTKLEQVMALQNRTLARMLLIQGEHERALLAQERKLDRLVAAHNATA